MNNGMITDDNDTRVSDKTNFTVINCNARSLCPKLDSLIDCMTETEAVVAFVTETWMEEGDLEEMEDRVRNAGYGMASKERKVAAVNGVTYGGVAIFWDESRSNFKRLTYSVEDWEILICVGKVKGHSRQMVLMACYLPPGYTRVQGDAAMTKISDIVVDMKRKYTDPFIVLAGDYNQWKIEDNLLDFPDIKETEVGATRNGKQIDRFFTNMTRSITNSGTLNPLETEDGSKKSDHRVAYFRAALGKLKTFTWQKFTYRYYNEASEKAFKSWVVMHDWREVLEAVGSNNKANAYQKTITEALGRFFPLKTTRRKSNELPWLDKKTKRLIKDRKHLYWTEEGRTQVWKEEKKRVSEAIKKRKRGFMDTQKTHLLDKDANRNFYRHVKAFCRYEKPPVFDVRELVPNKTDPEVAEELADYFIKVSREFDPIEPSDIPVEKPMGGSKLDIHVVAARLRKMRKPKSMVPGDIFPQLVTLFADF